jgi:hypothetical protein
MGYLHLAHVARPAQLLACSDRIAADFPVRPLLNEASEGHDDVLVAAADYWADGWRWRIRYLDLPVRCGIVHAASPLS